ncbi:zinc transport system substrate-binding protein [Thermotomaculum hydrothermale]|uniref:Zinc transport system substrate-binding protein n=1 Tax=Thermotomaculum hydrothermale TaxID=981385 RepID=A0A7R6PF32_9BACT|nr:metal ABC transporter substrate-binding protein [Thermotomaculum hydrothermale]BBB32553.1 zinc transport system substrate-binding protein [Thermotomaculum hydrothermale]
MKKLIIYPLIILFAFGGFAKTKVVTSIFPIADIVSNIVKDKADVKYVIPVNANPHTFEPTPEQAKIIAQADVFIGVSKQFDGWIEKFLKKDAKKYYLQRRPANPHIWLSFIWGNQIISNIKLIFMKLDPKNKKFYTANAIKYSRELSEIHKVYFAKFKSLKTKNVIQYHPAWEYLAKDLKLNIIGTIYTGESKRVSIAHLTSILKIGKKRGADALLCRLNTKDKVIDIYERELKLKRVELDPIGDPKSKDRNSYINLLIYNCEKIYQALNQ